MFPAQEGTLAQTDSQMKKKFSPLGPQIVAQVDSTELPSTPANDNKI